MKRRAFLLAAAVAATPRLAISQTVQRHRIAWLSMAGNTAGALFLTPFLEGMAAFGYVQGKNLELDARWGDNSRETLERMALEAAALNPALFVAQGPALHIARKLPGTTPIVFGNSGDPVESGVAKTFARPGGRFTGITFLSYELVGKRVELGGGRPGMEVSHYPATNPPELEGALAAIAAARAEAVVVHPDALMVQQRGTIGRFSIQHRIPTISGWATIAEGGSPLSYGPLLQESYRRLAYFVDRILRGAKPADLPIELPTKVELVVNLKTAKALGITIPPAVLLRADRVIV